MKRTSNKKLTVSRESLRLLQHRDLAHIAAGRFGDVIPVQEPDNYTFEGDCPATNTCKFCSGQP